MLGGAVVRLTKNWALLPQMELVLRCVKQENPAWLSPGGVHKLWQCPTLAQPRDALPLGLQRFTSVFGMGTGGATALWSPEGW